MEHSIGNFILLVLNHIIGCGCPFIMSILNNRSHMDGCLKLVRACLISKYLESLLQSLKWNLFKAGKSRIYHQLNKVHEFSMMLSHGEVTLNCFLNKKLICLSLVRPSKNFNEFFCHLEVRRLKPHVFSRTPIKYESKINVNQMSLIINQDVTIVSIFDLENVANYAICWQTSYEILSCYHEILTRFISVFFKEIIIKIDLECFTDLVSAIWIWNNFNYTT